ncbi:MAG: hypothetical protein N5P05_002318 [Chroococcopsis gigantea SAG 12.99]|jgi:pimeloyl-ACP methyl ester carboxylesterase|nr:lipase [Chlorogloea purpurea SAG 13.99]MDV3000712.1 hypothetical protein [Chroococcopsis gigantea SAG 12.99]
MSLPAVIIPGYFASHQEYRWLSNYLNDRGIHTVTVPINKRDWLPTVGGRSMMPILRKIDRTVKETLLQYNSSRVTLIGHSAGGWIARIYLGEKPYDIHGDAGEILWSARGSVSTLVTLGTPHVSQERWTKLNLDFVKNNYPDAFYPDVDYVCVAGKSIYGERRPGAWLAYNSYLITCGQGNTWGDGITPISAAHLQGATNLTFDGVNHSPTSTRLWYGSPEIVAQWLKFLP